MIRPKNLLLFDGLGAGLTAAVLGVVAWKLPALFGMPVRILVLLFCVAAVYMVYSLGCYRFANSGHARLLAVIAAANLGYCGLTASLVAYHFPRMTTPGIVYFAVECAIITGLAIIEIRTAFRYAG